ncbi:MAG: hypothetical protein ABI165_16565, partial [Bryobacteraceae bacterium]
MDAGLKAIAGDPPHVVRVATGFSSAAAPVHSRIGYLLFSDGAKILQWRGGSITEFRKSPDRVRSLTFDHQG